MNVISMKRFFLLYEIFPSLLAILYSSDASSKQMNISSKINEYIAISD